MRSSDWSSDVCSSDLRSVGGANSIGKRTGRRLQVGVGRAMAHHGELLQGVFEGDDGRLHRGLITLSLAAQQSTVTFWPGEEGGIQIGRAECGARVCQYV